MPGRPKLTPKQWDEVVKRCLAGESADSLGREFGVSGTAVRKRLGAKPDVIVQAAHETVKVLATLPPRTQAIVFDFAQRMQNVARELTTAAEYGANTAARLKMIANQQVEKIDEVDPMATKDVLSTIHALTITANESAKTSVELMRLAKGERSDDSSESSVITIDGGFDL